MESENEFDSADTELPRYGESPFERLPEEMFLYICSFLEAADIVNSLSKVCRQFYYLLQSKNVWRRWVAVRWGGQYPILDIDADLIPWKEACFSFEREKKRFHILKEWEDVFAAHAHEADVDAVLFFDSTMCFTGSRDRKIWIWQVGEDSAQIRNGVEAHEGWVWKLKLRRDFLFSTSWDQHIKTWHIKSPFMYPERTFK